VTNLVRNALDASSPQGRVKVAAEGAGGRLRVVVSDAGVGMPPEVLARAGEPFFTTKPPGQGQGLGIFLARAESPELAVVDLKMPGRSGLELVRDLQEIDPATRIVVLTGYGSIATALEAVHLGATHYVTKPADADDLLSAFAREGPDSGAPVPIEHAVPSLARAEWEHIQRVLVDCGGNVSQTARLLGIHRRSLQRKLARTPLAR
jgi:two-component system response regulator RegA